MLQYYTYTLKSRTIHSNNTKNIIVIIQNYNNNFTSSKSTIIQLYQRKKNYEKIVKLNTSKNYKLRQSGKLIHPLWIHHMVSCCSFRIEVR